MAAQRGGNKRSGKYKQTLENSLTETEFEFSQNLLELEEIMKIVRIRLISTTELSRTLVHRVSSTRFNYINSTKIDVRQVRLIIPG